MRLIDADALKRDVMDLQDCYNGFSDTYDKACIIGVIDEQPTVKPERKKGRWIKHKDRACWYCSECREDDYYAYSWNSEIGKNEFQDNYCPNCGAEMKGEENE